MEEGYQELDSKEQRKCKELKQEIEAVGSGGKE